MPFKKHGVPLEKSSFKLAAAEDFLEECFNRRRATERRCNIHAPPPGHLTTSFCVSVKEDCRARSPERQRTKQELPPPSRTLRTQLKYWMLQKSPRSSSRGFSQKQIPRRKRMSYQNASASVTIDGLVMRIPPYRASGRDREEWQRLEGWCPLCHP